MLEKYFVPYNRALKLEELGFDESVDYYYTPNGEIRQSCGLMNYPKKIYPDYIKRPLFCQAFNWFRENYWFDYSIKPVYGSKNKNKFKCNVYINGKLLQVMKQYFPDNPYFDTREEAELACLDKLIKIAENNETK